MKGINTVEEFGEECEREWDQCVFKKSTLVMENLAQGEVMTQFVFVEEDDQKMEKSIQRIDKERYRELETMSADTRNQ